MAQRATPSEERMGRGFQSHILLESRRFLQSNDETINVLSCHLGRWNWKRGIARPPLHPKFFHHAIAFKMAAAICVIPSFLSKKKKPAPQARGSLPSVALVKSRGIRINQLLLIYTVHHNVRARSDFFLQTNCRRSRCYLEILAKNVWIASHSSKLFGVFLLSYLFYMIFLRLCFSNFRTKMLWLLFKNDLLKNSV